MLIKFSKTNWSLVSLPPIWSYGRRTHHVIWGQQQNKSLKPKVNQSPASQKKKAKQSIRFSINQNRLLITNPEITHPHCLGFTYWNGILIHMRSLLAGHSNTHTHTQSGGKANFSWFLLVNSAKWVFWSLKWHQRLREQWTVGNTSAKPRRQWQEISKQKRSQGNAEKAYWTSMPLNLSMCKK